MVANKLEVETGKNDLIKWVLAGILFIAALFAFYYYDYYPLIYRVLGLFGVVVLNFIILFNTEKVKNLRVTVDYNEDYQLIKKLFNCKNSISLEEVIKLFHKNPAFFDLNKICIQKKIR